MKTVVFDSNVYDQLAVDPYTCELIRIAIHHQILKVIATRTIAEELAKSPFPEFPKLFPFIYHPNVAPVAGIMCAGDKLGEAIAFKAHLGDSKKYNDALIVDVAAFLQTDWLVSNNERMLHRLSDSAQPVAMRYSQFVLGLRSYCEVNRIKSRIFIAPKSLLTTEQLTRMSERTAEAIKVNEQGPCTCWEWENWAINLYAILLADSDLPIGAFHIGGPRYGTDVGWWIDRDFRRQGFGIEAIDSLALLLKARGVTALAPILVQGDYTEASSKLRARLSSHFLPQ